MILPIESDSCSMKQSIEACQIAIKELGKEIQKLKADLLEEVGKNNRAHTVLAENIHELQHDVEYDELYEREFDKALAEENEDSHTEQWLMMPEKFLEIAERVRREYCYDDLRAPQMVIIGLGHYMARLQEAVMKEGERK